MELSNYKKVRYAKAAAEAHFAIDKMRNEFPDFDDLTDAIKLELVRSCAIGNPYEQLFNAYHKVKSKLDPEELPDLETDL